jgi:adenosylcobinamide-phosphate synthase
VISLAVAAGVLVERLATALGTAGIVVEVAALKTTIAPRGLAHAARAVAEPLARGALDEGRAALGLHLVSRPTAALAAGQVASGAVESVAENLTDALVGPLLCFVLWGVPGALAYRALNTADTMLGYREGPLEHFGKVAARLDDVANLIPARLAALALVVGAGPHARRAWTVMARDHARTASPNAGWTMAAMAGALGVRLEKPGAYRLGDGPMPEPEHVGLSLRVFWRACALTISGVVVAQWLIEKLMR